MCIRDSYNTYTEKEKEEGDYGGVASGSYNQAPTSEELKERTSQAAADFKKRYKDEMCIRDRAGITNEGFHGLTQVLYEFASSAANNGSGFEGLADNTYFWNITTGLAMFFGRYVAIVAQLAIAGSLLAKKRVNETVGTLRTDNTIFVIILVAVVYIFAALTFFPALALGPIAEHLTLWMS